MAEIAWSYNGLARDFLLTDEIINRRTIRMRSELPPFLTGQRVYVGGADEAGEYVNDNGKVWQATPGAVAWLERCVEA